MYPLSLHDALPISEVERVVVDLERRLVLEGPASERGRETARPAWTAADVRAPACAGNSYPADPRECRDFLDGHEKNAGACEPPAKVEAVLAPHIDLRGGGPCHGAAARALRRCDADVFVVLGTAHAPLRRRFALTAHDFETPVGRVETDREIVELLAKRGGGSLLDDA